MLFASTRDIVESGALAYSIDHIRQRYLFVYRAGLFKRVRREEQYIIQRDLNIRLVDIFHSSLGTFLKRTTNNLLRQDDYQAFVASLKYETFDREFERYLTLDHNRKKWSRADAFIERRERRHWMSEFDMYNNDMQEEEEEEEEGGRRTDLTVVETKPSSWHPLSDYNPDRHRQRKISQNVDPNIRGRELIRSTNSDTSDERFEIYSFIRQSYCSNQFFIGFHLNHSIERTIHFFSSKFQRVVWIMNHYIETNMVSRREIFVDYYYIQMNFLGCLYSYHEFHPRSIKTASFTGRFRSENDEKTAILRP